MTEPGQCSPSMKRPASVAEDDEVEVAPVDFKRTKDVREDVVSATDAPKVDAQDAAETLKDDGDGDTLATESKAAATDTPDAENKITPSSSEVSLPTKTNSFESTSKGVREFLLKAASSAAIYTGSAKPAGNITPGKVPEIKSSGFGGGFGAFKDGPNPLLTFAKSPGSGFGGGFGTATKGETPSRTKTLLESMVGSSDNEKNSEASTGSGYKVLTGEEGELTMFEDQAKVYRFDAQELKWRERGKGDLKVKKRVNDSGDARFRLLLREPNTQRILVNMSIMPTMSHEISTNMSKQVRITGVNSADQTQAINAFMVVLKSGESAAALEEQLTVAIDSLNKAGTTDETAKDTD